MTIAFDTMKFVDRLVAGGFTDAQAKAAASAFSDAMTDSVAMRSDVLHATDRLDAKIDAVEARLDAKIDVLGARLDAKIDALGARLDAKIDAVEAKLDTKIEALGARLEASIDAVGARIDSLEAKIDAKFAAADARSDARELSIVVKMGSMLVVAVGVLAALMKLLH